MKPKTIESWVWVLIYGGLLCWVAGLAVAQRDQSLGQGLVWLGGIIAFLGAALILVRSRMK
jgi:hypothetical protein